MILGFDNIGLILAHPLSADQLLWYAKAKQRDFRFLGIYIGWLFIGFAWVKKA